jgi:hypothetical protein
MTKNRIWRRILPITIIMTVQITMAAIIVVILLVQQKASATTTTITPTASQNKCSGGNDIVTCTQSKKTTHPTKGDSTPFDLALPFP